MTWIQPILSVLLAFGIGWSARRPLANAWWHGQCTIAEARVMALEDELADARQTLATAQGVYLARLRRCDGCGTCNEPQGFDLTDHELGDTP